MKKIIGVIIVLVIGVIGSWFLFFNNTESLEVVETIKEVKAKKGDLVIDFISDGLVDMETYELSFLSGGILEEIVVELGDKVQAGDMIGRIDDDELLFKKRQAELKLEGYEIKVENDKVDLAYDIKTQSSTIYYIQQDLDTEKINLENMKLYTVIYTPADVANQQSKVDELVGRLALEQIKLSSLQGSSEEETVLEIEDMTISIALLQKDIEKMTLVTPVSGVVVGLEGMVGTSVGTTATFVVIQDQDNPKIIATVSEMDIMKVQVDQKVLAEFDSEVGRNFDGMVSFVNSIPNIDNNGIVTYEVEVELIETPDNLKTGLTTFLRFVLKEREDAIIIPNEAVSIVDGKQQVEVQTETGIDIRNIVTGLTDGLEVEIIQGLEAGETVLIRD